MSVNHRHHKKRITTAFCRVWLHLPKANQSNHLRTTAVPASASIIADAATQILQLRRDILYG